VSDRRPLRQARRSSGGFTIVELLVAMTLGLFLLGGVIGIFVNSRQSFRVNENIARVQENARFSFELLMREIREAGVVPCGTRQVSNVVAAAGALPWWANWDNGTLVGYDGGQAAAFKATGTGVGDRVDGTDAVVVLRPVSDETGIQPISNHNPASKKFTVPTPGAYKAGDLLSVCDATSAVILKMNSVTGGDLVYNATDNCTTNLGYPTECGGTTPAKTFDPGSIVTKLDPVFWYVGNNAAGGKSLYRMRLTNALTPTTETQEMVPNVPDLQIDYLMRDTATLSLSNAWITASDSALDTPAKGWTSDNLKQVVAVRLTLTLQSDEKVGTDGNALQRKYVAVGSLRARDQP
jgi:type IV pilus assembly protein PilW